METLPYDTDIEDVVLGGIIQNIEEYDLVSKYFIEKDVFYQKRAKLLWEKITTMKKEGKHIDTLTMCSSLTQEDTDNGLTQYYITKCTTSSGAKGTAEFYTAQIYEKYLLRKVIVQSEKVKEKALSNEKDVYDAITEAHSLFGELLNIRPSNVQDIEDVISDTLDSIKNKRSKLIGSGYNGVDKFSGGLTRGEITIIGGRPGHG